VRPDDKTTIQLVLQAAPQIGRSYSIIINKLPNSTVKKLKENESDRNLLITTLNEGLTGTSSIYYNANNADLMDESNVVVPLDSLLLDFINHAPTITISEAHVKSIAFDQFEKVTKMLTDQLEELKKDKQMMQEAMLKQQVAFREEMAQRDRQHAEDRHRQDMAFRDQLSAIERITKKQAEEVDARRREEAQRQSDQMRAVLRDQQAAFERAQEAHQRRQQEQQSSGGCVLQ
jgi:hypothetical protein